jgi:hypothetical protein
MVPRYNIPIEKERAIKKQYAYEPLRECSGRFSLSSVLIHNTIPLQKLNPPPHLLRAVGWGVVVCPQVLHD